MIHRMKTSLLAPVGLLLLSVVAAPLAGCNRESLESPRHAIVIEVRYPGANARVVADTIAAPIEQQINGVEKMLTIRSRSSDDGRCAITVTFAPGVDLSTAQTLVENRTRLALPELPDLVQRGGVVVRKGSAGVGLILFLSSPDGRFDRLYLSNYATIQVKDELARAAGVAEVAMVGSLDYSLRIWLDPDRLAAFELTATDVVKALERHDLKPAAAPVEPLPGKSPVLQMTVSGLARLATVEEMNDLVVQSDAGRDIRLRDVARVELGAARADGRAQLDGKPGVAMAIHLLPLARPGDVSAAVRQEITRLAANFPEGIALDIAFDFTANLEAAERAKSPQYVLLEMDAPPGASAQRQLAILDRADQVMRLGKEVERVLSLTDNVFDRLPDRPCVLVGVTAVGQGEPDIATSTEAIRRELEIQVADAAIRLRDLSRPNALARGGYPIDFAVRGPESDHVRSFARKLAERLRGSKKLTDVWTDAEAADCSRVQLDVDANSAKALGVARTDIMKTLQVFFGGLELNGQPLNGPGLNASGQNWQIKLQAGGEWRDHADNIRQLKVRNSSGEMVPLSGLVSLREVTGPGIEERLNGQPMVEITANPAAGVSLAEIRTLCETLAGEVCAELRLTADYRLTWLDDAGAAR
jgi:multidrug efflux pump subunit AcrB